MRYAIVPAQANATSGDGSVTITVDPFDDFHPGERAQATITDGVLRLQIRALYRLVNPDCAAKQGFTGYVPITQVAE